MTYINEQFLAIYKKIQYAVPPNEKLYWFTHLDFCVSGLYKRMRYSKNYLNNIDLIEGTGSFYIINFENGLITVLYCIYKYRDGIYTRKVYKTCNLDNAHKLYERINYPEIIGNPEYGPGDAMFPIISVSVIRTSDDF